MTSKKAVTSPTVPDLNAQDTESDNLATQNNLSATALLKTADTSNLVNSQEFERTPFLSATQDLFRLGDLTNNICYKAAILDGAGNVTILHLVPMRHHTAVSNTAANKNRIMWLAVNMNSGYYKNETTGQVAYYNANGAVLRMFTTPKIGAFSNPLNCITVSNADLTTMLVPAKLGEWDASVNQPCLELQAKIKATLEKEGLTPAQVQQYNTQAFIAYQKQLGQLAAAGSLMPSEVLCVHEQTNDKQVIKASQSIESNSKSNNPFLDATYWLKESGLPITWMPTINEVHGYIETSTDERFEEINLEMGQMPIDRSTTDLEAGRNMTQCVAYGSTRRGLKSKMFVRMNDMPNAPATGKTRSEQFFDAIMGNDGFMIRGQLSTHAMSGADGVTNGTAVMRIDLSNYYTHKARSIGSTANISNNDIIQDDFDASSLLGGVKVNTDFDATAEVLAQNATAINASKAGQVVDVQGAQAFNEHESTTANH